MTQAAKKNSYKKISHVSHVKFVQSIILDIIFEDCELCYTNIKIYEIYNIKLN